MAVLHVINVAALTLSVVNGFLVSQITNSPCENNRSMHADMTSKVRILKATELKLKKICFFRFPVDIERPFGRPLLA
jgi:hypothetical protein